MNKETEYQLQPILTPPHSSQLFLQTLFNLLTCSCGRDRNDYRHSFDINSVTTVQREREREISTKDGTEVKMWHNNRECDVWASTDSVSGGVFHPWISPILHLCVGKELSMKPEWIQVCSLHKQPLKLMKASRPLAVFLFLHSSSFSWLSLRLFFLLCTYLILTGFLCLSSARFLSTSSSPVHLLLLLSLSADLHYLFLQTRR